MRPGRAAGDDPERTGSIVILGSISGQVGGVQSGVAYATSKAAVIGLTKALARYAGPFGIRVNCVNPGYIEAGMSLGMTAADRGADDRRDAPGTGGHGGGGGDGGGLARFGRRRVRHGSPARRQRWVADGVRPVERAAKRR